MHTSKQRAGFTLVETLIVITLIGILAGFGATVYQNFQVSNQVDTTNFELVQALRRAQARAIAGDANQTFGLHVQANGASLFRGNAFGANDPLNETIDIPASLSLSTSFGPDVIFAHRTGVPSVTGTITLASTSNESRILRINELGTIDQL